MPYNEGPPYSVGSPQPSSSSPDSTDTPAQDDEGLPRLGAAAADVQLINDDGTRKPSASSPVSSPSLRPVQPSTLSSPEVPDESTAPVQISAQEPSPSVFLGDGHSPSMQSPASSPSSDGRLRLTAPAALKLMDVRSLLSASWAQQAAMSQQATHSTSHGSLSTHPSGNPWDACCLCRAYGCQAACHSCQMPAASQC